MPGMLDRSIQTTGLKTIAQSTTDGALISAVPGSRIKVLGLWVFSASTSTFVFNTKPSGAGTAITPVITGSANLNTIINNGGAMLFQTNVGEGLTLTTGAGGNTIVLCSYIVA
jgi:hypothetical protein